MAQTFEGAFREARFFSDEELYAVIRLPARAITAAASIIAEIGEPFAALIADKDEVSLAIPRDAIEDFSARLRDYAVSETSYRLITFDVVLEPDLVGFISRVSAALAEAGISILPYAAYSRDHVLVAAQEYDRAILTLETLRATLA
jgi:hypothetical protein